MAVQIDFGAKDSSAQGGDLSSHNADEVAKMQECITMIESGEGERAVPILKSLISGEAEEDKKEMDDNESPAKKPMSFREEMASKIQP